MNVLRLVVLASLLTLTGCGRSRIDSKSKQILENADRVEVFRIDGGEKANPKPGKRLDGYLVISQGKDQSKEFAKKLADNDEQDVGHRFAVLASLYGTGTGTILPFPRPAVISA